LKRTILRTRSYAAQTSIYIYTPVRLCAADLFTSPFTSTDRRLFYPAGQPVYRPLATKRKQFIALVLIIGNIELNPEPSSSLPTQFSFRLMNVRSAVSKAALIHDVIFDHSLDIAALTETRITSDEPNAVSLDVAPV